jgi:hypothetical protein
MKLPSVGAQSIGKSADESLPEPTDEELTEMAHDLGLLESPTDPDLAPGPREEDDLYPDWNSENSRVISGPLGLRAKFPGQRYVSWREAERHVREAHKVIKFWCFANRWYARIRK